MSLVIDASLTLAWYFEDEATPETDALLDRVAQSGAKVPVLWRLEIANAIQSALRRQRITSAYRDTALAELKRMPITVDPDTDTYAWSTTLRLADHYNLTLYDATHLELALRTGLPLATLDRPLARAATATGVVLASS